MTFTADDFEALHTRTADPWSFRTSWYEKRKRALTLAALPRLAYTTGFEPGCSIGELSTELEQRCSKLIAWDVSQTALDACMETLEPGSTRELARRQIPQEWPDEPLDLIVLSEIGYFLRATDLSQLVERVESSLMSDGTLLLCHWLHPITHGEIDGAAVHRLFTARDSLQVICRIDEPDFEILVMTRQGRSVAIQEGLV